MRPYKKYFTIEEADKRLPEIRRLVKRLLYLKKKILYLIDTKNIQDELIEITSDGAFQFYLEEEIRVNKEFHKVHYKFYDTLGKLTSMGCLLKDLDGGLVDFYYRFEGRDILLCWKLGEEKISHWHEIYAGYEGRKKILDLDEFGKICEKG